MSRCNHNDCFSCPYPDCISDSVPKSGSGKRKKRTPAESKLVRREINRKYYAKNKTRISEMHREAYKLKKEKNNNGIN